MSPMMFYALMIGLMLLSWFISSRLKNKFKEYKDILGLLNRSLIIIAKITDKIPVCLDSNFCDKFIKAFDFNINLLCTYYHSLSHFELLSTSFSTQKRSQCHKRTKQLRESTRCTPFISKSKTFINTTFKSSTPSHSSQSTNASSTTKSTQLPTN